MTSKIANEAYSVLKKIEKSLIKRGIAGTFLFCLSSIVYLVKELSPSKRRAQAVSSQARLEFDRRFGVDTAGNLAISNLEITSKNWIYGTEYQAIYLVDFEDLLKELCIPYQNFVFIDLGSGKGRAILLSATLPFKRIVGVEFSEQLVRIAENNVRIYPKELKKCSRIELVCMDAAEYPIPDEPLVLYLYNPFEKEVMTKVVDNVAGSFRQHPRRIVVVYFNPLYSDLWNSSGFLKKVKTQPRCHIYDTLHYRKLF